MCDCSVGHSINELCLGASESRGSRGGRDIRSAVDIEYRRSHYSGSSEVIVGCQGYCDLLRSVSHGRGGSVGGEDCAGAHIRSAMVPGDISRRACGGNPAGVGGKGIGR